MHTQHNHSAHESPATPPTIYHNARIFTATCEVNGPETTADALAVAGGRILAVGSRAAVAEIAGPNAHTIDLNERFVMPGICDSHIHLYDFILTRRGVPLTRCQSLDAMQTQIAAYRTLHPEPQSWLRGQGWNESQWPEARYPTAADLEAVTGPDQPAIFWRSDMHVAVCNHAALHRAGISHTTPDPEGGQIGRTATGAPNGLLFDTAIDRVAQLLPAPGDNQLEADIRDAAHHLQTLGITAIHDQRLQTGREGPRMLAAYSNLHRRGELPLRIHCNIGGNYLDHALALGLRSGFGDEWLRIGHVKYFVDGSLGSRTAWMLAPYAPADPHAPIHEDANTDDIGLCVTPMSELRRNFLRAMQGGLAISVHAIGDRANRTVLDLFEELLPLAPPPAIPHRIEHVQIIAPEDIPRLGALGLTASVQPVHALDDIEIAQRYLGARGQWAYPFSSLAQHGARLAFGSDAPVADPNPLRGVHAAVLRSRPDDPNAAWRPEQAVTLADALRAYTLGPAEAVGSAATCGTLEAGKCADFIVLDQNPFAVLEKQGNAANLADLQVRMTVLAGAHVYEQT